MGTMGMLWMMLVMGCVSEHPSDALQYQSALEQESFADLSACDAIADPDLRGDCQLVLALRMEQPGQWCAQVHHQPWQGECWFVAAEGARDAGQWQQAIAHCQQAGPFLPSCNQHLWQDQLHARIRPHEGADFTTTLTAVSQLYHQWHVHLGDQMTTPFWTTYVRQVLQTAPTLSPLWCSQLPEAHQAICFRVQQQLRQQKLSQQGAPSQHP